jgi:hypothetical protein
MVYLYHNQIGEIMYTFLMTFSDDRSYRIGEWTSISRFGPYERDQCIDQIYAAMDRTDPFLSAGFVHKSQLPGDSICYDFEGFDLVDNSDQWNTDTTKFRL